MADPGRITGSDLCFSIRSVLLVEELTGDKLKEKGVRGERKGSGSSRDSAGIRPGRIRAFVVKPMEKHTF